MEIIDKFRCIFINSCQSTYVRKIGLLVAGSGSAQAVLLLTAPILSRAYSPEDFGNYGVFSNKTTTNCRFNLFLHDKFLDMLSLLI